MTKQTFYIDNPTRFNYHLTDLGIILPPGQHDLFELEPNLTWEEIRRSMTMAAGTLRRNLERGNIRLMPPPENYNSVDPSVIIRRPQEIQVSISRTRFAQIKHEEPKFFDEEEEQALFGDDDDIPPPATELFQQLNTAPTPTAPEEIEQAIKDANLEQHIVEDRYVPPVVEIAPKLTRAEQVKLKKEEQRKLKRDMKRGYIACAGRVVNGQACSRRPKVGSKYCGFHRIQAKPGEE